METLQNLLTLAIEVVAIAGFGGIALHSIWSSHCKWMNEYCPAVEPVVEPAVEPAVETAVEPAVESVVETAVEPAVESVVETAVEPVVETAVEPVVEPTPVQSRYEAMNVKRLRQECQIHCIDWKKGGDYGKPMRKNQMIRALTV